jgi:hypothetical protein
VFPKKWYGVKIIVYPDGKCETEFNHDPECAFEATFLED